MIDSSAKSRRKEDIKQMTAFRTGMKPEQVELLFIKDAVGDAVFQEMYGQVEQLQEALQASEQEKAALVTRSDLAAMRAQEYFVRLRDLGGLTEGEKF